MTGNEIEKLFEDLKIEPIMCTVCNHPATVYWTPAKSFNYCEFPDREITRSEEYVEVLQDYADTNYGLTLFVCCQKELLPNSGFVHGAFKWHIDDRAGVSYSLDRLRFHISAAFRKHSEHTQSVKNIAKQYLDCTGMDIKKAIRLQ
jgi:hypothetical protein